MEPSCCANRNGPCAWAGQQRLEGSPSKATMNSSWASSRTKETRSAHGNARRHLARRPRSDRWQCNQKIATVHGGVTCRNARSFADGARGSHDDEEPRGAVSHTHHAQWQKGRCAASSVARRGQNALVQAVRRREPKDIAGYSGDVAGSIRRLTLSLL